MNGSQTTAELRSLEDVLQAVLVVELPKKQVGNRDDLYASYSAYRTHMDRLRGEAQESYHDEVNRLNTEHDDLVLCIKRHISEEKLELARHERETKHLCESKREQYHECIRRHSDGMRALKLWYSRELHRLEAADAARLTTEYPIEPEISTQNPE